MRVAKFAGLIAGLTLSLVASHVDAQSQCPKRGGTIGVVDMNYATMDPTARVDPEGLIRVIYDSLIDVLPDLTYRPGLAEAMPEMVGDRGYVFRLRRGVKFHDGTDFDAAAVKYNLDRIVEGRFPTPYTGLWRDMLDKLVVVDPHTVRFELKAPSPGFYWNIASTLFIGSPTAMERHGAEFGVKSAAGTGPFILKSFTPNQRLEATRNPNYYRQGEPCVDTLVATFIASGNVRLLSLKKGELTNVFTFPESLLPLLSDAPDIKLEEGTATTLSSLLVNTRHPALRDKRVRKAIQHAINGPEIIQRVYRGRGAPIESIFPPWHPFFVKASDLSGIRHDPEAARRLLVEAGFGPDKPLKLSLESYNAPAHVERATLLQAQLKAVGVELAVRSIPAGQAQQNVQAGRYELSLSQYNGGPTAEDYSWLLYSGKSGLNFTAYNKENGFENPAIEPLLVRIAAAESRAAVEAEIRQAQAILFDDVPVIFMDFRNHREAWRPELKGHTVSKLKNRFDFRTVWLDR
jgi:peptide/nickel transport system substrate-binding protein